MGKQVYCDGCGGMVNESGACPGVWKDGKKTQPDSCPLKVTIEDHMAAIAAQDEERAKVLAKAGK